MEHLPAAGGEVDFLLRVDLEIIELQRPYKDAEQLRPEDPGRLLALKPQLILPQQLWTGVVAAARANAPCLRVISGAGASRLMLR